MVVLMDVMRAQMVRRSAVDVIHAKLGFYCFRVKLTPHINCRLGVVILFSSHLTLLPI